MYGYKDWLSALKIQTETKISQFLPLSETIGISVIFTTEFFTPPSSLKAV